MLVAARKKMGNLNADEHITYTPSPLICGEESIDHVMRMPAVAAMIVNGDLANQLRGERFARSIEALEPYIDAQRRPRLRVVWAT
jgi:hypothetical protein